MHIIKNDIPGYRNFIRMVPALFDLIEERRKSPKIFRKPLEVGLKLAVSLRHLSIGESYTSLQYYWGVGRTICKFVPQVFRAILEEFQQGYLICPTDTKEWRKIEEKFRSGWNVPHAVGALYGKHIAMKKPKKSGSCGSMWGPVVHHLMHRYSTIANFEEKLRMVPWDFHPQNHLDLNGQICTTYCWRMMPLNLCLGWPSSTAEDNISSGSRVVENAFGILVGRFRVLWTTMEQRPKVVRDIVLT